MKKVAVLMSTYNGEKYIEQQLESLIKQEGIEISILIRDDGSKDKTQSILSEWAMKSKITWYQGENLGPALSFMDLVRNAPKADFYAFCDQDDYWDEDKLKVAVEAIEDFEEDSPALYFSNKRLVDEQLRYIRNTNQQPTINLGSALIINPVTGCTLVINEKLLSIVKKYNNKNLYMHDAWIYRICMAFNGNVCFDKNPHISYRQHSNNVIGGTSGFSKKFKRRIKNTVIDRKRIRERDAIELLNGYSNLLDEQNLKQIEKVAYYRKSFKNKLNLLLDNNFRTTNIEYDFSFFCAVLFNSF
ncbi:glycosyltransferase family 2 protein [Jeotgalibaca porci]|uniref:glycosyltransferase family 2 protein n=1 Tax=Jeotgalibaca porci TaxID=1868793 RepID=UPI003F91D6E4